jgi:hypothetical protein
LLQNVAQKEEAAQSFYQTYFKDILQHVFSVVTDSSHTAGTKLFQLYRGGQFYWWRKQITWRKSLTNFIT